jgi:hypothetical protein
MRNNEWIDDAGKMNSKYYNNNSSQPVFTFPMFENATGAQGLQYHTVA